MSIIYLFLGLIFGSVIMTYGLHQMNYYEFYSIEATVFMNLMLILISFSLLYLAWKYIFKYEWKISNLFLGFAYSILFILSDVVLYFIFKVAHSSKPSWWISIIIMPFVVFFLIYCVDLLYSRLKR